MTVVAHARPVAKDDRAGGERSAADPLHSPGPGTPPSRERPRSALGARLHPAPAADHPGPLGIRRLASGSPGHPRRHPLGAAVRRLLVPLLPRARYLPDFLTPAESADGLDRGLAAVVDTPPDRVAHELSLLRGSSGAPAWAARLVERPAREELAKVLRAYYDAVVAPHHDRIHAELTGERALRAHEVLATGVDGLLSGLSPAMRWCPPVLHVDYVEDRDLHLDGRGLRLVPTYFCWQSPVSMADPQLRPVLIYPFGTSGSPPPYAPPTPPSPRCWAGPGRRRCAASRPARPPRSWRAAWGLARHRDPPRHGPARLRPDHQPPRRQHRAAHPHPAGRGPAPQTGSHGARPTRHPVDPYPARSLSRHPAPSRTAHHPPPSSRLPHRPRGHRWSNSLRRPASDFRASSKVLVRGGPALSTCPAKHRRSNGQSRR